MYLIDYDKLFNDFFETPTLKTPSLKSYNHKQVAVDIKDDVLKIGLAVPGHTNETLQIDIEDTFIRVKSIGEKSDNVLFNSLALPIDENLNIGKSWDIQNAEASVKDGILYIAIEKLEEKKPKKVSIKVG